MKKGLSILLVLVMIATCIPFTVSAAANTEAPQGKAINTWEELASAVAADSKGSYYLAKDIGTEKDPVKASIEGTFTGTLDGNGKTVYTKVPLFKTLGSSKIKNLTVSGNISVSDTHVGAIARQGVSGIITMTNVVNNVNVTLTNPAGHSGIGGFIGFTEGCTFFFTDCVNNGNISGTAGGCQVNGAGFVGRVYGTGSAKSVLKNCVNNGNVTDKSSYSLIAGFFGFYNAKNDLEMTGCKNTGKISVTTAGSVGGKVGGFIGVNALGYNFTFTDCVNEGVVDAHMNAGGFIGQFASGNGTFTRCSNKAEIKTSGSVNTNVGGIVGYHTPGGKTLTFDSCSNSGKISTATTHTTELIGGFGGYFNANGTYKFVKCVNTGDISSNTIGGGVKLGGIVGVLDKTAQVVTMTDCVNSGNISAKTMAAGMIADLRGSKTHVIKNCVNLGDMSVVGISSKGYNSWTGGLFASLNCPANISLCANYGNLKSDNNSNKVSFSGGLVGFAYNTLNVSDSANYGTVTAPYCAGGIVGNYAVKNGSFTRCANFGEVVSSYYYGTEIAGLIKVSNPDANVEIVLTDCFGKGPRAVGIYAAPADKLGNVKFVYTANNVTASVKGGVDTVGCKDYGEVLVKYNETFTNNGSLQDKYMRGVAAGKYLSAYDFGNNWIIRESYPELKVVDTLVGKTVDDQADKAVKFEGVQESVAANGEYSVRFVSKVNNIKDYTKIGFKVNVVTQGNSKVVGTDLNSSNVYSQITALENGVKSVYPEKPVADTYYSALTVTGLSDTATYTFVVTAYTVLANGDVALGSSVAVVYSNGQFVDQYFVAAPVR